jgi:hypothetical protein
MSFQRYYVISWSPVQEKKHMSRGVVISCSVNEDGSDIKQDGTRQILYIKICGLQLPREPHRSNRFLRLTDRWQSDVIM